MKSWLFLIAFLTLMVPGLSASVPMNIGERGSIVVPFYNNAGSLVPVEGVKITATTNVPGLNILSTSFLGPVSVFPGRTAYFHVDFELGPGYNLNNRSAEIVIDLVHTTPTFLPASRRWVYKTQNLFRTLRADCQEPGDIYCGEYVSPDTDSPTTEIVFDGTEYIDNAGSVYVSANTLISFIGGDKYVADSDISGVAITAYKIGAQPSGFVALTPIADPISLSAGNNVLYFASRDYKGNTEVIKSKSVVVDAAAPGAPVDSKADGKKDASPWKNVKEYTLSWTNPSEVAGIAGARVKFGAGKPNFNSDGVLFVGVDSIIYPTPDIVEGPAPIWMWLEDNVGNANPGNAEMLTLYYDGIDPFSSASSPEYSNTNVVAVAFAASDEGSLGENHTGSGVKETVLWHRHNDGAWSAGETKTGLSGTFSFDTQGALGTWEFYTQVFDKAGNFEPPPGGEVKAKTDTFVDSSVPMISGLSVTAFSPDTAVLEWTTDDETTAVIDYNRTATQGPVSVGQYNETKLGRIHRITITGLPNPAEINFNLTAKNRTGLTTAGQKSCNMPLNVSYETDLFGVIDYSQPVKVYVTNPEITQASLMVNGSVWSGPVGVDKPATLLVDPATTGDGSHELHTSAGGYEYASSVVVDAAVRTVKLVRLVISAGGAMNPDGESAATAGQAAQQEMAAPGGGSKLYPGYYAGIDPVAPAAISLAAAASQAGQITLKWTAPGDDGGVGTAMQYEVRYSPEGITDGNFNSAALAANIQPPRKAGDDEVIMISGLGNGKMYYFAIKAYDELMNSSLSNIVAKETLEVAQSEEKIGADPALTVISPIKDVQIKRTDVVANAAALKIALAAGLAPIGNIFEITTTQPFPAGAEAQVHFRYANPVDAATEKDFAVYKYSPASGEWTVLIGALDAENNIIRAVTSSFSLYAIFGKDKTPPLTTAALSGGVRYTDQAGNVFVSGAAKVTLTASDSGGGIERTEYRLDSSNGPFELYVSSVQIAEGWHTIQFRSVDKAGNAEAPKSLFMMKDALAPRVELNFDKDFVRLPSGIIHISSTSAEVEISALDQPSSGSGLKYVRFELDGVEMQGQSAPLDMGRHSVVVHAEDNVGNVSEMKADVVVGDLLPPIVTAPANNFAATISTVAFSWQHQTTTFFSLTEYDLMLGGEPGFTTPEFTHMVSSQVKVTILISEAGISTQGLEQAYTDGPWRLTTNQEPDLWTGTLEGVMETPRILLPANTTGISDFTVVQSINAGTISHEYNIVNSYWSSPYQPIEPGASVSLSVGSYDSLVFRSTLRRSALTDASPTMTRIEFTVNYLVNRTYWYCGRYYCYPYTYSQPYSYQANATALSAVSKVGLRFNGSAAELITEPGALTGEWLSLVYPVPEGAFRIGDFLPDYDLNGGDIRLEFSKSGGDFKPVAELDAANFKDGNTLQFKAVFSRTTSENVSPVFRGIKFNFIAPPPTETSFNLPAERKYYWRVAAKDYLGRFSAPSEERLIIYDTKPPLTEHLLEGATGQGGWYVAPVSASLISTDAVAGVGGAYYSVDGSTFALYASSFTLNTEGTSLFRYYSEDAVGNREAEKSFTAKIDLSSPSIMASVSPAPNQWGWNNTGVGVVFSGSDTVSGLAYCTSSATVAGEIAGREVAGACFDNAGLSSTRAVSVSIDTTAPSIQYAQSPAANELGWNTGTVTVKFTCADNLSGIRACPPDVYLVGDGASISTSAKVYDSADNSTGVSVTGIKIDRTLPISSAALSGTYKDGWYSSPVGITLTSTDSLSGIKETLYSMNGAAFSPYLPPMTVTADGVHAFRYYSKDKAGNAEAEKILSFSIDRTAPQIGFALNPQPNSNDWNNSSVQAVFNGTDTLSGMDICVSSRTSAEGAGKTLSGWCRDIAGNISYSTAIVNVDFSSPVVSAVQTPLPNTHGWNNVPVMVRFSGMDAISGTASCTGDTPISVEGVGQQVLGSCTDRAGNVGSYVRAVNIDRTPPAVNISSPAAGQTYIATRGNIPVMYDVSDNFDTAPAVEAFFVQTEDRGSPRGVRPAKLAVSKGQSIEPLSIDDGIWRLTVSATDFADNAAYLAGGAFEVVHDVLPPRTAQTVSGGPLYAAGSMAYIRKETELKLTSADDLVASGDAAGLGVKGQSVGLKTGGVVVKEISFNNPAPAQNAVFVSTFSLAGLADGLYYLLYKAVDVLENTESTRISTAALDNTAPVTAHHIGSPYYTAGGVNYITPATPVTFTAGDPAVNAVASGVNRVEVSVDGAPFTVNTSTLNLAEGRHAIKYRAIDNLGNTEAEKTLEVRSDNTPPVSGFNASGQYFEAAGHKFAPLSFTYLIASADPVMNNVASGVKFSEYRIDGGAFGAYASTFTLSEGIRLVEYRSQDNVSNLEQIKLATVHVDATAPATALVVSGGMQFAGSAAGSFYASLASRFGLAALDPLSNGVASGVKQTSWRDNNGAVANTISALAFNEGRHELTYWTMDNVENVEVVRSTTILVDNTAPVTEHHIGSPYYAVGGVNYITPATPISFTAADPVAGTVASGVSRIEVSIDGAAFGVYSSPLTFIEGRHTIKYRAIDNVGNTEAEHTLNVQSDATAPVSDFISNGQYYIASGKKYAPLSFTYSLTSADSVVNNVTSGVKFSEYRIDGGTFGTYTSAFSLAEGVRLVEYRSHDNVLNAELLKAATVYVDATDPMTALAVTGGMQFAGPAAGSFYASLASRFGLVAADPLSNSVASGVKLTSWRDNNGTVANTVAGLAFAEGRHELGYWSTDNVENVEVVRSTTILVDNTSPVTEHHIGSPYYIVGGVNYITPSTPLSFTAADPAVSEVSAGVARIETAVDGGQWQTYAQPLKFAEGRHTINYRAIDNVGNTEAGKTLSVQSDATAPVSAWLVNSGEHIELGGKFYLNALGKLALESSDPVVGNVASGVEGIYYGIDSTPSTRYTALFGLTEGIRTLNFNAKDNVANTEVVKSTAIYVDGTKPVSELSISGDQYHGDKVYVSLRSDIVLAAADPLVSEVASGLRETRYSVDGGAFADYSSFKLAAEGKRLVSFYSADQVANVEVTKTTELWVDATAPTTALSISGARHDADGLIYLTKDSGIVLTPADPLTNETASGVMLTKYRIDGGVWQVYATSFTITAEGRHTLEYYSLDRVQNAEILKTAALAVDNTPPATAITLGEPKYEAFGLPILRPETPITIAAADIMASEVVSGLRSIFYEAVNLAGGGSVVHSYVEPFTLPQGTYDVRFWSVDNVGNIESYKQKRLAVSTYQDDSLQAVDGLDLSGTADIAGAVKSNSVVSVSGNARILGDVTASTITLTGSNAQVTGQILNGQTPLSPEPIYLPAIAEGSGSAIPEEYLAAGELTLNSQAELALTTGTYYVKGIKLSGGSNIRVAGKVELLVSGEISISGGSSFNASGAASGLTIFVNTASTISFTGGGNLVARVYAPYSHLKLAGNALLGGHFFAKRAAVSGTGNIIKAGETLPQTTSEPAGGGGKKKASALAVGGGSYDVLAGPDPAFRMGEVYVFPNPAKGSEAPVFHIETGIAESVKVNIYTVSGRVAHEHTLAGLPVELDDGNGLSYAYEYVWRGHIPSGVYLYYIEARKAGQTLKKTGKFSVVR